jgi:hypothetical protein
MDEQGVLEAARAIRPYLATLVGPAADQLDRRIAELLNTNGDVQVAAAVSLLESNETTGDFLAEVLADAPDYRPPELQPGYVRRGGGEYRALAGDAAPVLHAGKYTCPQGDYVWYQPAVGTPIPDCPTHGPGLIRT